MNNLQVTPERFFQACQGFHLSYALKAAVSLDLFTGIGAGHTTPSALADWSGASERGVRILCDFLCIQQFLEKGDEGYKLTEESKTFLNRESPLFVGDMVHFLVSDWQTGFFQDLTEAVRKGGSIHGQRPLEVEDEMWINFARNMAPTMVPAAEFIAENLASAGVDPENVLDIAAGHGMFGIAVARRFPESQIVAVDWPGVLSVAKENVKKAGLSDRFQMRPGNAFQVEFGESYDAALLTNFLHHFDLETCTELLKKIRRALAHGGCLATLEFIPDPGRLTPPPAAAFPLTMLATTENGDAYTFEELESTLKAAGFDDNELLDLPITPQRVILSR